MSRFLQFRWRPPALTVTVIFVALWLLAGPAWAGEIHLAAENGDAQKVKALLAANPECANERDREQKTPLHFAAAGGHLEVVNLLLAAKADVNARSSSGITPTYLAKGMGKSEVAALLVKHGGSTEVIRPQKPVPTPPKPVIIKPIPIAPKPVPIVRVPIIEAARTNGAAAIAALVAADPTAVKTADANHLTALHHAVETGSKEAAQAMLFAGADVNARALEEVTPLHMAVKRNDTAMAALLLSAKADVNARTVIQATPLLLAAALGKAGAMCELLLKAGADIQARDKYGNSALILAAMAPEPDGVGELLIQAGAEINAQEKGAAFAALHHAVLRGNRPLVELLLARKANPNLALADGETPLALARFEGRKEIAALLQQQGAILPPEKPMDAVERTLVEQYRKHYELVAGSTFEELRKLLSEAAPTMAEINQVFVKGSQTAAELQDRVRRDEAMAWGAANRNAEDRQNFLEIIRAGAKPGDYIRITPLPASPIAQAARARRWISSTVPMCQLEIKRRGGETYVLGDFYRPAQRWVIMPPLAKVFPELVGQQ